MASHLTFTPSASVTTTKGFNTQAGGAADAAVDGDFMGAFAALLGAANPAPAASATATAEATTDLSLGNLLNLPFGAGFGDQDDDETTDPEAIAAVIDVPLPIQPAVDTKPLTELVDSLAALKQGLAAGDAVDPDLLKRIDAALDHLAEQFDLDLSALPSLDDLKALTAAILPDDTSIEAQLTAALAPLAQSLLSGSADADATTDVELSALLKQVGEKLGALLQSLNGDGLDADKLAALGLDADVAADADLEAAIAKLVDPQVKVEATANAQVIAAPTLKLTEPVLTGKNSADAGASVDAPADTADAPQPDLQVSSAASDKPDADDRKDTGSDDRKPADAKTGPSVAVAAAADATLPDPQVSAQPTHVASRIDAAAARPVVQAGYQTSQQQLNLPQLAFELVRQVNDGNTRFQMRLDPPELGRIDVKLDIDSTGQVNARLTVERAETLDLMQRDQRGLERALQQAGLDSSKTNLEFSLKQSPFGGGNQQGQDGGGRQPRFGGDTADAEDTPPPTINLYRGSLTASGVNIIA